MSFNSKNAASLDSNDNPKPQNRNRSITSSTTANSSFFSRRPTQSSFTAPEPFPIDVVVSTLQESTSQKMTSNNSIDKRMVNNNNINNNNSNNNRENNIQESIQFAPFPLLRSPERPSPRKQRKLFSISRGLTKAPRLLGRRIKHFFKDDLQVDVHFRTMPSKLVTKELATLEVLAIYHRWLRGVHAFLAIIATILSLLTLHHSQTFVNSALLILSIATCMLIVKVYHVKAQLIGVTNVLFAHRNVLASPLLPQMLLELVLNCIFTPPLLLFWPQFFELFDYFVFLRLYSVVLYLNNALFVYRTFCRAMSAMSDLPLSTSFLIRAILLHSPVKAIGLVVIGWWIMLGSMFAHAEEISWGNGLWLAFQTLSTIGYGDVSPLTLPGQCITVMGYVSTVIFVAYLIVLVHGALSTHTLEIHNLQTLFQCHDLSHALQYYCAYSIQLTWRFHKLRKRTTEQQQQQEPELSKFYSWKQKIQLVWMSWRLTRAIAHTRHTRHALQSAQRRFREPNNVRSIKTHSHNRLLPYFTKEKASQLIERTCQRQRERDVEAFVRALTFIDRPASSLRREEIDSLLLWSTSSDEPSTLDQSRANKFNEASNLERVSTDMSANMALKEVEKVQVGSKNIQSEMPSLPDLVAWKQRIEILECKCQQLNDVIDKLMNTVEESTYIDF